MNECLLFSFHTAQTNKRLSIRRYLLVSLCHVSVPLVRTVQYSRPPWSIVSCVWAADVQCAATEGVLGSIAALLDSNCHV